MDNQELIKAEEVLIDTKKILQNRQDDYDYGRDLMYISAEKLQDALEIAIESAQESGHPRAIEVAGNLANQLAEVAAKMMEHHLRIDKLNNPTGQKQTNNTTNNLNVKLNTSDLLELLNRE